MSRQLKQLLNELHGNNSLKAWSLIITFFGDSIAPRGGAVSSASVQAVMTALAIGEGTVRTAFSRLAKDSWVTRQKIGRNSYYELSPAGQAPFCAAEAIIYAPHTTPGKTKTSAWFVVIRNPLESSDDSIYQHGTRLTKECYLWGNLSPQQRQYLDASDSLVCKVDIDNIPSWIANQIAIPSLAEKYRVLRNWVMRLNKNPTEDPLTAIAIRTILIHEWRRLLLTANRYTDELLPADWPHDDCHHAVAELYRKISPLAEHWLDQNASGPNGPLLHSDIESRNRFC